MNEWYIFLRAILELHESKQNPFTASSFRTKCPDLQPCKTRRWIANLIDKGCLGAIEKKTVASKTPRKEYYLVNPEGKVYIEACLRNID